MSQFLDTEITEDDRLRQIARYTPGVIYQFRMRPDGSSCFPYASDGLREVHGVYPTEVFEDSSKIFTFIHPEDIDRVTQSILESAANMTPWYCQYRVNLPEDRQLWLLCHSTPQLETDGSILWHGYIRDITESKTTELALQSSENKFRSIIENLNDMVYIINADAYFSYLSPQFQEVMGYEVGELLNDSFAKLVHPEDLSICVDALHRSFQGEKIRGVEYRTLHKDGNYYWHSSNLSALRNDDGEVVSCLGVARYVHDRKAAELELEKFFDVALDLLCIADFNGHFRRLNRAWETTLGYSIQELEGQCFLDFVHPDDIASTLEVMSEVSEQKPTLQFINRYRAQDGSYRYIEWRSVTSGDLIYAAARDITEQQAALRERQAAETALAESEAQNRAMLQAIPDHMFRINREGIYLSYSESKEFLNCFANVQVIGQPMKNHLPPNLYQRQTHYMEVAIETRQTQIYEQEITVAGQIQQEEVRVVPIENQEEVLFMVRNISDRKAAETQIKEVSERLSLALKSGKIGCWEWDIIQNILMWDDRMYEIYGVNIESHRDLAYDVWANGLHPDDRDTSEKLIQQALLGQAEFNPEFRVVHPDGSIHFIKAFGLVQHDAEGNPQRMIGVNLDISEQQAALRERKQAENLLQEQTTELEATLKRLQNTQTQLIQAEKMSSLGQLVGGIAHEINNPVSFIYGNIQPATDYVAELVDLVHLYQEQYPDPPQVISKRLEEISLEYLVHDFARLLESMKNGATRIRDIIKSLRTFSRLDEEGCKATDIYENIDSTLMVLESRFNGRDGKPEIQLIKNYGDLPRIECYGGLLNQVFVNLLMNAIDAIEQQRDILEPIQDAKYYGVITITTSLSSTNQAIISIHDNGCGMNAQIQEKIFNPFFTTKPIGQGTGMGLAISYQIVTENHQGHILVNSALGKGTEFILTMPIKQNLELVAINEFSSCAVDTAAWESATVAALSQTVT